MFERIENMCGKAEADALRDLTRRVEALESTLNPHAGMSRPSAVEYETAADEPVPVQLTAVGIDVDGVIKPLEDMSCANVGKLDL